VHKTAPGRLPGAGTWTIGTGSDRRRHAQLLYCPADRAFLERLSGATAASSAAEQAKQGQQTEQRVQQQVEAAKQVAADKLKSAEDGSLQ